MFKLTSHLPQLSRSHLATKPLVQLDTTRSLLMAIRQPHVVIIGGAYGGLSVLNSLISLSNGLGYPEIKERGGSPPGPAPQQNPDGAASGAPPAASLAGPPQVARGLHIKPRYTLVDERDGFYHTVGAPLGQISPSHAREFWVKYNELIQTKYANDNVDFAQGVAVNLDTAIKTLRIRPTNSTQPEQTLSYDFIVVATGMSRGWPVVPKSLDFESYLQDTVKFEQELAACSKIVLIGGGACGIEMSAELKVHFPEKEIILLHSRADLLSREPLTDEFKSVALKLLREQGVDVRLNTRLIRETSEGGKRVLELSTGETLQCNKVIYTAVQQGPNTNFVPKSALDGEGYVLVQNTFQFPSSLPNAASHYAIGDVIRWTGIKRSGPAQLQGKYAAGNIVTSMIALEDGKTIEEAELAYCPPSKPTMTLAIGEQAIGMRMGLRYGAQVKIAAFGTGLGIDGTLANLGLRPRRWYEAEKPGTVTKDAKVTNGRAAVAITASI